MELIKCVEHNIDKFPTNIGLIIHNRVTLIINNFTNYSFTQSPMDKELIGASLSVWNFLHDNPDVIFTKADKGNVIVTLNKVDYLDKMNVLLGDNNTYAAIKQDTTKKNSLGIFTIYSRGRKIVNTLQTRFIKDLIAPTVFYREPMVSLWYGKYGLQAVQAASHHCHQKIARSMGWSLFNIISFIALQQPTVTLRTVSN